MASRYDVRDDPRAQELLGKLPSVRFKPVVGAAELEEIVKVFDALPEIEFPVTSAGELIDKLGGSGKMLDIVRVSVDPMRMIKYMPAYYFPIASMENFIEKMAELVRQNRKEVDIPRDLAGIKQQLPSLRYPINSQDDLQRMVGIRGYKFRGREVTAEQIMHRLPADFFPVRSEEDFDAKVSRLMATRPLIEKD